VVLLLGGARFLHVEQEIIPLAIVSRCHLPSFAALDEEKPED
jgi:hypothetical protein